MPAAAIAGARDPEIVIESLDHEGRGIGRVGGERDGKVIFVEGALVRERVRYSSYRKKPNYENAVATEIIRASPGRVEPRCPHFEVCGGCSLQHLDSRAQVAVKQRVLEDALWHIGKLRPAQVYRAIHGPSWGYRTKARLTVRDVAKKGGVLVGFHEKRSSFVADMKECHVLPPAISALLAPLRGLVGALSIRRELPQIELAVGDAPGPTRAVLVLRILAPLTCSDEALLRGFADRHGVHFWLQTKGPDSAAPFYPSDSSLAYTLPEFGIRMPFMPTDFIQVNPHINRVLIARALALLDPQPHERIADLFCGLGNFSLPIATRAGEVVGIEGSAAMTRRALENAQSNRLSEKCRFITANLFEATAEQFGELGKFDKMLIDPPREGALAVVKAVSAIARHIPHAAPTRLVYVSCNPPTLARDASVLVHEGGYVLCGAGVVNMFPQTSHVESIAVFEKAA